MLVIALLAVSCGKDKGTEPKTESIVGMWQVKEATVSTGSGPIVFHEDGTVWVPEEEEPIGRYEIEGDILWWLDIGDGEEDKTPVRFVIEGNTMTWFQVYTYTHGSGAKEIVGSSWSRQVLLGGTETLSFQADGTYRVEGGEYRTATEYSWVDDGAPVVDGTYSVKGNHLTTESPGVQRTNQFGNALGPPLGQGKREYTFSVIEDQLWLFAEASMIIFARVEGATSESP